jgi:hypothetical protein
MSESLLAYLNAIVLAAVFLAVTAVVMMAAIALYLAVGGLVLRIPTLKKLALKDNTDDALLLWPMLMLSVVFEAMLPKKDKSDV